MGVVLVIDDKPDVYIPKDSSEFPSNSEKN